MQDAGEGRTALSSAITACRRAFVQPRDFTEKDAHQVAGQRHRLPLSNIAGNRNSRSVKIEGDGRMRLTGVRL